MMKSARIREARVDDPVGGDEPVVSVVLAARNEAAVIRTAIDSIIGQTWRDWELIVVDDGSTDDTADVVEAYDDPRIRVIRGAASGLPQSLNIGLGAARGQFVARQDADDVSLPSRLAMQVGFLDDHPDVAVVGALWREVGPNGESLRSRARVASGRLDRVVNRYNPIAHTAATFRRDVIIGLGGYDETFPYAADYDLWLRVALAGGGLWNLEDVLVVRAMTGTNMSSKRERGQIIEELRIRSAHLRRSLRAGRGRASQPSMILRRAPVLLAPLALRRRVRRRRGQAE